MTPSPSSVSPLSLGPPVTLPLELGSLATFATGGLPKVVDLRATEAAHVCILLWHFPEDDIPFVIFPLPPRPKTGRGTTDS